MSEALKEEKLMLEIEKLRLEIRNGQPVVWLEISKVLIAALAALAGVVGATVAAVLLIQRGFQ